MKGGRSARHRKKDEELALERRTYTGTSREITKLPIDRETLEIQSGAGRRGPLWLPLQARKWRVIHSNTAPLGLPPGREPGQGTD